MGNYEQLKRAIADVIKSNGNQEITGQVLQNTLNSVVSSVGSGAIFVGKASPSTSPGSPDQNVFYIAAEAGTYPNFGGMKIGKNEVAVIYNTDGIWRYTSFNIAQANVVNEVSAKANASLPMTKNGVLRYNLLDTNDPDYKVGYYLSNTGKEVVNAVYAVTGFIPLTRQMGAIVSSVNGIKNMASTGAYICLYDSDKKLIASNTCRNWLGTAKWQDGVCYARFSIDGPIKGRLQVEVGEDVTQYMPYGNQLLNDKIVTSVFGSESITKNTTTPIINSTLPIDDFPKYIKNSDCLTLYADIDLENFGTSGRIYVGKGFEAYRGAWVEIYSTHIDIRKYEGIRVLVEKTEHNLQLEKFIKVIIDLQHDGRWHIILQSLYGSFEFTSTKTLFEANGSPFVRSYLGTLTNVSFKAMSKDFKRPVWAFGDSYFGVTDDRWVGALRNFGYSNFLVNGLAGNNSATALADLKLALNFGTPKYLIWALGMNDSNFTVWKNSFEVVRALCEERGIELIAMTAPTVPERDKEEIYAYIINSGLRYIDAYKAVGSNNSGAWYSGYLADGVHPTVMGAQAIATQVLVDFPEITQY